MLGCFLKLKIDCELAFIASTTALVLPSIAGRRHPLPITYLNPMKSILLKLVTLITVFGSFSYTLRAQIPDPVVYFDFEGDGGDAVVDKGINGNDGIVARPGQTTLGDEGAPGGSTPATGASFSDGLIEAWANLHIEFALTVRAPLDRKNMQSEWLGHSRNSDGVNGVHFIVAAVCSNATGGSWELIKSI